MTTEEKAAYRHLLYAAFIEIRGGNSQPRWWWPPDWFYAIRETRSDKTLANDLHNLALFNTLDFEKFDPDWFWRDLARSSPARHAKYRRIFDGYRNGTYELG